MPVRAVPWEEYRSARRQGLGRDCGQARSALLRVLLNARAFMETVKVSSKGQIVIPKAVRDAKHITAGTELAVSVVGEQSG